MPIELAAPSSTTSPILEPPLPREVLNHLYATMLRARHFGQRFRSSHLGEAILAGTLENAAANDTIVSGTPSPTLELLRGADPITFLARRNSNDDDKPIDSKIVVADPNVFSGLAAGIAFAHRRVGSDSIVLAFAPGKLTRSREFQQSIEFAGGHRLPLVIIADWTDSRTSSRNHDGASLSHWPSPTIAVDGRDVIAVYRVTKEATSAARRGHGPTLIDCVNFLAPGPRGRDTRDPLKTFRAYLERHNAWDDSWQSELLSSIQAEIANLKNVGRTFLSVESHRKR